MCGRFASTSNVDEIIEALGVEEVRTEPLPPRYNVAPSTQIYAVATSRRPIAGEGEGAESDPTDPSEEANPSEEADPSEEAVTGTGRVHRVLGTFRWGLVPSWAKDIAVGYKMINARSEGIAERPAYRRALTKRRCIIPVDYYYEWQVRPAGETPADDAVAATGKGRARKPPKLPWAIHRADGRPMQMAGLWEVWHDPANPDAEPVRSATIVTTSANDALAAIHDRMPVILDSAGADAWLDPDLVDKDALGEILRPAPPEWFAAHPVSTRVNKVGVDGPELLVPIPDPPPGVDLGVHLPR